MALPSFREGAPYPDTTPASRRTATVPDMAVEASQRPAGTRGRCRTIEHPCRGDRLAGGLLEALGWTIRGGCLDHGRGQRARVSAGGEEALGTLFAPPLGIAPCHVQTFGAHVQPSRGRHGQPTLCLAGSMVQRRPPSGSILHPLPPLRRPRAEVPRTGPGRASGMPVPASRMPSAGPSGSCPCADTRPRSNAGGGRLELLPAGVERGPSAKRHYAAAQPRHGMDTAPPQGGARGRRVYVPSMPCPWCRRRERPAWHPVPWRIRQAPPVRGIIPASAASRPRHPQRQLPVHPRPAGRGSAHGTRTAGRDRPMEAADGRAWMRPRHACRA